MVSNNAVRCNKSKKIVCYVCKDIIYKVVLVKQRSDMVYSFTNAYTLNFELAFEKEEIMTVIKLNY